VGLCAKIATFLLEQCEKAFTYLADSRTCAPANSKRVLPACPKAPSLGIRYHCLHLSGIGTLGPGSRCHGVVGLTGSNRVSVYVVTASRAELIRVYGPPD